MSGEPHAPEAAADELHLVEDAFALDIDDAELLRAIERPAEIARPAAEVVAPSAELHAVAQRIAGQSVDVIAQIAGLLFAGVEREGMLDQLDATLVALDRLAVAAHEADQHRLLAELRGWIDEYRGSSGKRARARFLDHLRAWLPAFAAQLGDAATQRLRDLAEFDPARVPLFEELAGIHGMGPRRLRRLYLAGLHSVEAVCAADPREVAEVTGLPHALTAEVVERTREYAEARRRRAVTEMRARLNEFMAVVRGLDPAADPELHSAAERALNEMRGVLHSLTQSESM